MGPKTDCETLNSADAALKMFRETFTLMRFFAEQKCPGPQGARGPKGCQGAEGGGDQTEVGGKISQAVCAAFGKHAAGLTQAFWSVMCDPPSNPFARFIPQDHQYQWSPFDVVPDINQYADLLVTELKKQVLHDVSVTAIVRQTLDVIKDPMGVVAARTLFKVDDVDCPRYFLITSVEACEGTGPLLLFVSDTQVVQHGGMESVGTRTSFEQYLIDIYDSNDYYVCKLLTGLGRLYGGVGARTTAAGYWVSATASGKLKLTDMIEPDMIEPNRVAFTNSTFLLHDEGGTDSNPGYVLLVPRDISAIDKAYDGPYIVGSDHTGPIVIEFEFKGGKVTKMETPTGVTVWQPRETYGTHAGPETDLNETTGLLLRPRPEPGLGGLTDMEHTYSTNDPGGY
jgi:hypothetical protein